MRREWVLPLALMCAVALAGCTVKAVGDPNRPITINAHITIDIKAGVQHMDGLTALAYARTDSGARPHMARRLFSLISIRTSLPFRGIAMTTLFLSRTARCTISIR